MIRFWSKIIGIYRNSDEVYKFFKGCLASSWQIIDEFCWTLTKNHWGISTNVDETIVKNSTNFETQLFAHGSERSHTSARCLRTCAARHSCCSQRSFKSLFENIFMFSKAAEKGPAPPVWHHSRRQQGVGQALRFSPAQSCCSGSILELVMNRQMNDKLHFGS